MSELANDQTGVTVTLTIDYPPPPSLNRYTRMHWRERAKLRQDWSLLIRSAARGVGNPHLTRASVLIRYYFAVRRRRDHDNAIPKVVFDGLVDAGILPDDDPEHVVSQTMEMHIDRERPRVEIVLREV